MYSTIHMYMCSLFVCIYIHKYIHVYVYIRIYIQVCVYTYVINGLCMYRYCVCDFLRWCVYVSKYRRVDTNKWVPCAHVCIY